VRRALIAAALLCACPSVCAAHELDGIWVNEAGSAVEIEVGEDGRLSGLYRTELGAPDAEEGFALTGWVQGDVVAFSVSFTGFGSITSWSGQVSEDEDGPFLRTLWHYTKDIPDAEEADDLWRTVNAGFAVFRPTQVKEQKEPPIP
jgi:hypothetical protein